MKKWLIGVLVIVVAIFSYLIIQISKTENEQKELEISDFYKIPGISLIDNIVWGSSGKYLYARAGRDLLKINVESRESVKLEAFKKDFEIGFDDGRLLICFYENFLIDEPGQIATSISVEDLGGHILEEFESSLTVGVIDCEGDKVIVRDNYPGNPGRVWEIGFDEDKEKEISQQKTVELIIDGILFKNKTTYFNRIALLDQDGYIWIEKSTDSNNPDQHL